MVVRSHGVRLLAKDSWCDMEHAAVPEPSGGAAVREVSEKVDDSHLTASVHSGTRCEI